MSRKKDDLLHKKDINTLEDALDYIEKLKSRILKVQKANKNLRSQNKTYRGAWNKTEDYLEEVTEGKPLSEILETARNNGKLKVGNGPCFACSRETVKKLVYSGFHINICESCGHRERVDEVSSEENE